MSLWAHIERFDSFVIERILEPLFWRIEFHTGLNNFFWARAVVTVWPIGMFFFLRPLQFFWIYIAALAGGAVHFFIDTIGLEKQQRPGVINSERRAWPARFFLLAGTLVIMPSVVPWGPGNWTVAMFAAILALFIRACSLMPGNWDEKYRAKRLSRRRRPILDTKLG